NMPRFLYWLAILLQERIRPRRRMLLIDLFDSRHESLGLIPRSGSFRNCRYGNRNTRRTERQIDQKTAHWRTRSIAKLPAAIRDIACAWEQSCPEYRIRSSGSETPVDELPGTSPGNASPTPQTGKFQHPARM